jgi:hypothetical protein
MPDTDDGTSSCTSGSLSVLLAFGEPVTFTATVSQNSPPASPEPVTYAGWGPWEVNTGYPNPSSFQIFSAGKDEAGSRTAHSGSNQLGMGDGSVRLADASDLFVFDGNSQPIGDQNSPPPVTHTGGHFALELEGHNASPPVDYGTGSFIIQNVSDPATIDASLVFDSTGGDRSTVLLPYLEQRGGEADDGGFVIDWTTGDGPKGGDTVGVIAIITPTEHGSSILEFSVENFPAFPQPENNAVATESLEIAHEGFLGDSKGVINWFSGDGGTISDPGTFPTETTRPMGSDGQDDGWCMGTEIDFPESVHALYDLIV